MLFDGITLVEGSELQNLTVDTGTSFPVVATEGELFYRNDGPNEALYVYNGSAWIRIQDQNSALAFTPVNKAGDTMTGILTLSGNPVNAFDAATKQYVDNFKPAFSVLTGKPTTLTGYGITDAQPLDSDLTAIASLNTTGLIVRSGTGNAITRSITGAAGRIAVADGDGVVGAPTIDLATVGTAGTYYKVTTDVYGRVTSGAASITAPEVGALSITGGTLTGALTLNADPSAALHAATKQYVDAKTTAVSGGTVASANKWTTARDLSLTGDVTGTLTSVDGTANVSAALTLATVNANVGAYGSASAYPVITVNAKGLVTAVSTQSLTTSNISEGTNLYFTNARASAAAPVQSVAGKTGAVSLVVGDVSGAAPLSSPVLTGTPTAPTAIAGTNTTQIATTAFVANAVSTGSSSGAAKWTTPRNLSLTGDATATLASVDGSANVSAALTFATVNANIGTFGSATQIPVLTVNAKGLVTAASNQALSTSNVAEGTNLYFTTARAAAAAPVQSVAGRTGVVTLAVADVTGAAPLASPALTGTPTAPTALIGTNTTQIATTAFVQSAVSGVQGGTVASAAKWTTARDFSLTGDGTATFSAVDGSANVSSTLTLATVNSNTGSWGTASSVPTLTVNGKGLVTAASNTAIAIGAAQVTSGTFTDARIAQSNVTQHQASLTILESQITDGSVLARVAGNETISGTWSFSNAVTGIDPVNATHFATKQYVDNIATGLDFKASVRVATTANITLTGTQTIDGVALAAGDRVLVKDQTNATQNGIYVVAVGSWARAIDADNTPGQEVTAGLYCFVEEGTVNQDTGWVLTTNGTITLGSTNLTFAQFTGLGQITAGNGITKTGSIVSVQTANAARITVASSGVDLATVTDSGSGTLKKVTVDAYGRVTGTQSVSTTDLTTLLSSVYQPLDADLTAIAGLTGTSGYLKKTAADTWTLDTQTYLSGNQNITVSGDASGSGTTSIALTLATVNSNVGSFGSASAIPVLTVNAKGLVTAVSSQALLTTNVAEGTNLYFTTARAQGAISVSGNGLSYAGGVVTSNATPNNTASTIVARDASGNFAAGQVTANAVSINSSAAVLTVNSTAVSTITATQVDSFSTATYRSVKYQIQISDSTQYEMLELSLIHDGTNVYISSYGNIWTGGGTMGAFDASITAGTCAVTFTATAATSKTVKMVRTAVAV